VTVSVSDVRTTAHSILVGHWRPEGYAVPNASVYPFQWLWDSCFHAICWAELGEEERAVTELAHVFRTQFDSGFVPHVDYQADPSFHADFWGRPGASSITQPPMYGHTIAELVRRDVSVPSSLIDAARAGLGFLLDQRARDESSGLVTIVHPWESGADDSPRWDHWCGPGGYDPRRWYDVKGRLLDSVVRDAAGAPLHNPAFGAAPVAFNALVAFNARELAGVCGDRRLDEHANRLFASLARRFEPTRRTYVDAGPAAATSGRCRTADALLVALDPASEVDESVAELLDDASFGGSCGPAYVHRAEPSFAPHVYWRGPAWPQLSYLFWVAARAGARGPADELAARLVRGATASGFAEYWDADDGTALGARPQSWTALAAVVSPRRS
jgi:hypothetical protein